MRLFHRPSWLACCLGAALMLSPAGTGTRLRAQAVDVEVVDEGEPAAQQVGRTWVLSDAQFDHWVFGGPRNSRTGGGRLDSRLALQIDDLARMCRLSDIQKKKLLLTGRGDIKRFFEQVEEKRKKIENLKHDQNKIGEIYQELLPLRTALNSGLFSEGSMYAKTIRRVLDEEQETKYQRLIHDRIRFRYRAKVELVVAQLDQSIGFRDKQRRGLVELIISETLPPTRCGPYDYYLVLYQAGKVDEGKLKPLFDDRQWLLLHRQLDQGRGMEQFLKAQGLLPATEIMHRPRPAHAELPAEVFGVPATVGVRRPKTDRSKDQVAGEDR